jgi:penicillin-binding protein 1A
MKTALNGVPEAPRTPPPGVTQQDGDWVIPEFLPFFGRTSVLE